MKNPCERAACTGGVAESFNGADDCPGLLAIMGEQTATEVVPNVVEPMPLSR
ncbi:hypothetical protein ACTXGQ_16810 [Marinobacter sp. 1Y8]